MNLVAPSLPGQRLAIGTQPNEIPLPHPAIEELPCYLGTVTGLGPEPGIARRYNGSICRHDGRIFMAYRYETFRAVSKVGICELSKDFAPIRDVYFDCESRTDVHIEDPHLASVDGMLVLFVAHVILTIPPVCRQRAFAVSIETLQAVHEFQLGFGSTSGIEKNWTPFETPGGKLAFVYQQNPRMVIEVDSRKGFQVPGVPMADGRHQPPDRAGIVRMISGRTPPLRIGLRYLEFVGGHVPDFYRGARYWFGALMFEAKEPYPVKAYTTQPLAWGSEASPTLHSPRPQAGHPCCLFPSGAMIDGEHVIVSCGVNDSYTVLLRFSLSELLAKMTHVA